MCSGFVGEFQSRYANTRVVYASKAFVNPAIAKIVSEEGLGLDVVSGGELAVAKAAGAPMDAIYFHGNNKTPDETTSSPRPSSLTILAMAGLTNAFDA